MAAFVTLAEIKEWLSITKPDYDSLLTTINEAMCQAVISYVEHDFTEQVTTNEVLDANQSDSIVPRNWPIVSVQALYFHTQPDGSQGQLIDASDYQVLPEGIVLQNFTTPVRRSRIRVDYTWGYPAGLPADVKLMMLQAVEAEWRRRGQKTLGVASRSKKDESHSFTATGDGYWDMRTGLPNELIYKLNNYKQSFEWPSSPMATRNW
jgi:hypothetical protein